MEIMVCMVHVITDCVVHTSSAPVGPCFNMGICGIPTAMAWYICGIWKSYRLLLLLFVVFEKKLMWQSNRSKEIGQLQAAKYCCHAQLLEQSKKSMASPTFAIICHMTYAAIVMLKWYSLQSAICIAIARLRTIALLNNNKDTALWGKSRQT